MTDFIGKGLIAFAHSISTSKKYLFVKNFFRNLLENDSYKYKKYFDIFMILLVLTSVFILLYDVNNDLDYFFVLFDTYIVTSIFIVEYLIRLWISSDMHSVILEEEKESLFLERKFRSWYVLKKILKDKWNYIRSPFAIIDLLAILPAYRPLRVLRVFVLFRVFKVLRYTKSVNSFLSILTTKRFEISTLLVLVAFITFVGGAIMYVFEGDVNDNIHNFLDALYWSFITITTVGYGDISPITQEGRVLTMFLVLSGIGFISFVTSIIASAFTERLSTLKKDRVEGEIDKLDNYYIICGYSSVSTLISEALIKDKEKFIIISMDNEHIQEAYDDGHLTYKADITQKDVLERFDLKKINGFFVLYDDDILNTFLSLSIRAYSKDVFLISLSNSDRNSAKLKNIGVNYVLNPTRISSLLISQYVNNPITFSAIESILYGKKNAVIDEIEVLPNSFLVNKSVNEIDFDRYKLILIGILKRNSRVENSFSHSRLNLLSGEFDFNPDFDVEIEKGDTLIVMGYKISINHFKDLVLGSIK